MARQRQRSTRHSADLDKKLKALASFAAIFESPGFSFGKWVSPPSDPAGIMIIPYFELSKEAMQFAMMAYEVGWVKPFNWPEWMETQVARRLTSDPAAVAGATAGQLSKLLTTYIRGDRFSEGALNSAFESGLLTAIVKRAQILSGELKQKDEHGSGIALPGMA